LVQWAVSPLAHEDHAKAVSLHRFALRARTPTHAARHLDPRSCTTPPSVNPIL
jgi:hypothetical protein